MYICLLYTSEQEFDVEIKEVLSRVQKVKAESLDDAINKAMDMYYACLLYTSRLQHQITADI